MAQLNLNDILNEKLIYTDPNTSIYDCILQMEQANVGCLFISDKDQTKPGIFTERDVLRVVSQKIDLAKPVKTVMTTDLICATKQSDLKGIFSDMIDNLFRHMPIKDESGKVIAVVSLRAICQKIREGMH